MTARCGDCTEAAAREWHGFVDGCKGCTARAAARGPHFWRVRRNGMQDREYRAMLEQFNLTHEEVKAAAKADAMTDALQPADALGKHDAALG